MKAAYFLICFGTILAIVNALSLYPQGNGGYYGSYNVNAEGAESSKEASRKEASKFFKLNANFGNAGMPNYPQPTPVYPPVVPTHGCYHPQCYYPSPSPVYPPNTDDYYPQPPITYPIVYPRPPVVYPPIQYRPVQYPPVQYPPVVIRPHIDVRPEPLPVYPVEEIPEPTGCFPGIKLSCCAAPQGCH